MFPYLVALSVLWHCPWPCRYSVGFDSAKACCVSFYENFDESAEGCKLSLLSGNLEVGLRFFGDEIIWILLMERGGNILNIDLDIWIEEQELFDLLLKQAQLGASSRLSRRILARIYKWYTKCSGRSVNVEKIFLEKERAGTRIDRIPTLIKKIATFSTVPLIRSRGWSMHDTRHLPTALKLPAWIYRNQLELQTGPVSS